MKRWFAPAAFLVAACAAEPPATAEGPCQTPDLLVTLPDAVEETSGVAASRTYPGIFWTHNDSGHDPVLFAVDSAGTILARVRVRDATNRDWEDIAIGPCNGPGEDCLFIGEIGDNSERHPHVAAYRIPEPDPADDTVSAPADRIRFTYPDGPRDAEALYVTDDGIHVIPKGRRHAIELFRLSPPFRTDRVARLEVMQQLAPPPTSASAQVTAAAVSHDGTLVVVRSYSALRFLRAEADTLRPVGPIAPLAIHGMQRGEAVDFVTDRRLVLTGERGAGFPATLALVHCEIDVRPDTAGVP